MKKQYFFVFLILCFCCSPVPCKESEKELVLKELKFHIREEFLKLYLETPFNYRLINSEYMKHFLSEDFFKPRDIYQKQSCFEFLPIDNSKVPFKSNDRFFFVKYSWYWKYFPSENQVAKEYYRIHLSDNDKVFILNDNFGADERINEFNRITSYTEIQLDEQNILEYLSSFLYWTSYRDNKDSTFIVKDQSSKEKAIKKAKLNMNSPELNSLANLEKTIKIQEIDGKYFYVRCLAYFPAPIHIYNDQILECAFFVSKKGEIIGFEVENPFK